VKVFVNGDARELAAGATVETLVLALGFAGRRLAVEVNEEIVPKSLHAQTTLRDGDRVEIVHAIGGG
jgi:sulfur carrier protein